MGDLQIRTRLEIPDELVEAIAGEVIRKLKPYLNGRAQSQEDDLIFDVKGLCEYLKVSSKWIYERTHLNEIPFIKYKGLLRFRKRDIDRWLSSYQVPAVDTPERVLKVVNQQKAV